MKKVLQGVMATVAMFALPQAASANLIQAPNQVLPGGVGNSNVILSLQSPGNSTTE